MRRHHRLGSAIGVIFALLAVTRQVSTQLPQADAGDAVVFVGAGDIANCDMLGGARATAALLDGIDGTVFTTGDHAYQSGSAKDFEKCYEPTWGRHKARTRPAIGNHDMVTDHGKAYFEYFGENAGPPGLGYYSYDLGNWHIISLNSAAPARNNSPQMKWLQQDLAAHPVDCTLAYWHIARFSSGAHGGDALMSDVWKTLYEAGADIVLSSHDHDYERFAPQTDKGKPDPERGIREFVVGTGGGGVYEFKSKAANSEVRDNSTYGVLKLTLKPGSYDWQFIPMAGKTFTDAGTGTCSPKK
jgi:3',5'-cyclic AMP phosphodiesterase CpdA